MRFRDWLRNSNEAKPIRDAMELIDKMPMDYDLKSGCFSHARSVAERTWEQTKKDLDL